MALGLIAPTEGGVEILGQDLAEQRAHVLPRVGALVEQPALYATCPGATTCARSAPSWAACPRRAWTTCWNWWADAAATRTA